MLHTLSTWDFHLLRTATDLMAAHRWLQILTYVCAELLILIYPAVLYALWRMPEARSHKHAARKAVVMALMAVVIALAVKGLMALVLVRDRPFITHPSLSYLHLRVDPPSFPSGHTLVATTIAASLLWSGFKKAGGWMAVLAVFVGLGRIFAGVHYPSDVLGGALIGIVIAWYIHREASDLKKYLPDE